MELGVNDISKYPGFVLFLAVNVQGPLDLEVTRVFLMGHPRPIFN